MSTKKFWLNDIPQEKKKEYTDFLKVNPELKKIREELERALVDLRKLAVQNSNYEKSSWPYQQADIIGQERALTRVHDWLQF